MSPQEKSWHIPFVSKYERLVPEGHLHVFFLQRMPEEAREQVLSNIRDVDKEWATALDVPAAEPRTLVGKPWIRDYWPSSSVILKIAENASTRDDRYNITYNSFVFVDSGWEAGNVIAGIWEGSDEARRLNAVRVPMNVANVLLSTCDANEGCTLSRALGDDIYEDAKVDFYEDSDKASETQSDGSRAKTQLLTWPDFLPQDLKIPTEKLYIVSLRNLTESEIQKLRLKIAGNEGTAQEMSDDITIYNWEGDPPRRTDIRYIFRHLYEQSPEADRKRLVFFIDNILQDPDGGPQIIAASQWLTGNGDTVKIAPVPAEKVLQILKELNEGQGGDHSDIWSTEVVEDLREKPFVFTGDASGAPVFFLQPFTLDEERTIRSALKELDDVEDGEDWGKSFTYFGLPWADSTSKHSMQDLRDLFQNCDPWSPTYNPKNPGPYSFSSYPRNMILIDEKCLDPEEPMVIIASSLDFYGETVDDQLGWIYGYAPAKFAYIAYTNLWLANMGPEELIDDTSRLWLTDLKEYAENEWAEERARLWGSDG